MIHSRGSIEVICGGMFSGKTEELIKRIKRVAYAQKSYLMFKPQIDTRYADEKVVSHSQLSQKALSIQSPREIYQFLPSTPIVIGIDEAQFFSSEIVEVVQDLSTQKSHRVILAGLDLDYLGKPFGSMPLLMALADSITKVNAICMSCGQTASRSQKIVSDSDELSENQEDSPVFLGAEESYEARCRHCFQPQSVIPSPHVEHHTRQ